MKKKQSGKPENVNTNNEMNKARRKSFHLKDVIRDEDTGDNFTN